MTRWLFWSRVCFNQVAICLLSATPCVQIFVPVNEFQKALKKTLEDIEVPKQNWLLVINPAGGKGKAAELTEKHVLPMLNEADFSYEKVVTAHRGYALLLIKALDYKKYTGVALVGGKSVRRYCLRSHRPYRGTVCLVQRSPIKLFVGDGLFHEGVNGLMEREDRDEVIQKLLFFQIPGGSGNCVASSLVYSSTGILIDSENLLINSMVLLTTGQGSTKS